MTRTHAALTLLSAALIAYQITLMSVLSLVQWYHFAAMVISVALLGFGASGTFLTLARTWSLRVSGDLIPASMLLSGLTMPLAVAISQLDAVRFDVFRLLFDFPNILPLVLTDLAFFVPFFLGALPIGLLFMLHTGEIGRLYFFNLTGSGAGAVLAVILAPMLSPEQIPSILSFLPILGGGLLAFRAPHSRILLAGTGSALLITAAFLASPPRLVLSEYKTLSKTLLLPEAKIEYERPTPRGLIQVISSPALRSAPGLSLRFEGDVPPQMAVFRNGEWIGSVSGFRSPAIPHLFNRTTLALPYAFDRKRSALILDAGTGMRVSQALRNGVAHVTAVESHPQLVNLLTHELGAFNDSLFSDPRVSVMPLDSRTFLLRDTATYDIISLPLLEEFGGSSGLFALQEQYLLTKEAFAGMWNRLNPEGTLSVSTWLDYPPRASLRILATIAELLEENGREYREHLAAIKSWGTVTFAVKKSPIREHEIAAIRNLCRKLSFDPLFLPGLDPSERDRFNVLSDTVFMQSIDRILSADRESLLNSYPFRIAPATDERPYFHQFLKWGRHDAVVELVGTTALPFLEVGYLFLLVTAMQIVIVALILIMLPLMRLRGTVTHWTTILYFACLGVGYILVELTFIQQLTLYWGHPVTAATAVIGGMLVFSGIGSWYTSRIREWERAAVRAGGATATLLLIGALLLTSFLRTTVSLEFVPKLVATLLVLLAPSFVMGMMFPLGLRILGDRSPGEVPWAWGINGATAVAGGAVAVILLVELGTSSVLILCAGLYALAVISLLVRRRADSS